MTKPIKPAGWLVLDPEGGYEYGCMDPDIGRDFCHQHIKDAQESGIPRARKWVVRESFSRDQVERATAELRAEVDALKRRLGQHDACNGVMGESGYVPECISMHAEVERLRAVISNAAHKLEQQRVWGGMDWAYPAMHPRVWRAVLKQLDAALKEPTP